MPGTQASVCVLPGFIREFHKRIRTYSVPCPTVLGTGDEYIRGLNLKDITGGGIMVLLKTPAKTYIQWTRLALSGSGLKRAEV